MSRARDPLFRPGALDPPFEILMHCLVEEGKAGFAGVVAGGEQCYRSTAGYSWEMLFERAKELAIQIRQERTRTEEG